MAKTRIRRVFGRVRTFDAESGKPALVELTRDGVEVRIHYQRRTHRLGLADLVSLAKGQQLLKL